MGEMFKEGSKWRQKAYLAARMGNQFSVDSLAILNIERSMVDFYVAVVGEKSFREWKDESKGIFTRLRIIVVCNRYVYKVW